jgi:ABC-type transport system involved in multi-copper enzyme maturation permease subunit
MKNVLTVAKFTFIDVYRSKVMASVFFLAIGLLLVTYIASEFAYGAPAKVALDFGLGIITLSNLGMAIFIGSTLIYKEIEQRTLYMILSRSIHRSSFIFGKLIGLSLVLIINTLVLSLLSAGIFYYLDGHFQSLFIWATYFSFIEAFIIMLFSVLFSLLTNTTMSVIYSLIVFIVGHSINETSKLFFAKNNMFFKKIIDLSLYIIPNFYKLNLKDFVLYKQEMSTSYLVGVQSYAFFYTAALILIIIYIFKNKNLD